MKRVGPELKMPSLKRSDLKVPAFISDLYWDLRDRRLLPLVALLVVAIIAAPILLTRGSGSEAPGPKRVPNIAVTESSAKGARLTVVEAQPGLRKLKQRFAHRKPTDPFKQRFVGAQVAKAEANAVTTGGSGEGSSSSTSGGGSESVVKVTETSGGSGGGGEDGGHSSSGSTTPTTPKAPAERGSGGGGGAESNTEGGSGESGSGGGGANESSTQPEGSGETRYYEWTAKIQIAHTETAADGTTKLSDPEVRSSVKSLTPLPGQKTPVVTFIGVDPSTGNGLFVVSKEVTAIYGEGKCISGTTSCEVVELVTGFPETFEYGPAHVRWKLNVLGTQMIRIKKPAAS